MFGRLAVTLATSLTLLAAPATATAATTIATAPDTAVNVAHRGASARAPENTIPALELAASHGADVVEFDVQETRDHKLVLMHDTTLARTTNAESVLPGLSPWRVGDLTLAQIRKLDAGSWFSDEYARTRVPTLDEALRAADDSGVGVLLEVKAPELYPGIEQRIVTELRRHPEWVSPQRLVVQSFDWDSMRTFHRLLPSVPIALLGRPSTGQLPEVAKFADQVNPHYTDLSTSYVRRAHDLGLRVLTYTVDSASAMRRLIDYGVDGIVTNRPDVLRSLIDG
ncbi:glycerophosphodiester phosphodiesterase [Nonomuraea jiangxiensis]|uniref:Glycerophosphoryl diester phosphodiesterase n=1 Tax=Nonomuraea jiangxiensis TaxID=633440 RepID=A0A1G9EBW2_9ACTN|nr:glycerophosphodiester phosphodiesterase family protein [Nonomuraea jiangxiensis]SDK73577.1 glycerophosphoryl diester phosphodiesterase [Nonomuraea jiangxiensis]